MQHGGTFVKPGTTLMDMVNMGQRRAPGTAVMTNAAASQLNEGPCLALTVLRAQYIKVRGKQD